MQLTETLRSLCALPAVSGFEAQAAQTVADLLRPLCDTVETDRSGSVLAWKKCGRKHAKTVLLDAHLDQIGFVVTEVLDGGFVRFAPVGGVDPRMLLAAEVTILADEPLYGVVSCLPPHLLGAGEQDKAVPIDQMTIDTGLMDAKSRIRIGTPIVFRQPPVKLMGGQYCSKCLDDRAGVAAILLGDGAAEKGQKAEMQRGGADQRAGGGHRTGRAGRRVRRAAGVRHRGGRDPRKNAGRPRGRYI